VFGSASTRHTRSRVPPFGVPADVVLHGFSPTDRYAPTGRARCRSRSIRSTQIEPTEPAPKATNTRVDSFASRRSLTSEIGDPNTVGAERHAVYIGLRGVRYGGFGGGCRKRYDFVPHMTCPTARSPRTGTATAPLSDRGTKIRDQQ